MSENTPETWRFATDGRPEILASFVSPVDGSHFVLNLLRPAGQLLMLSDTDRRILRALLESAADGLEDL